MYCIFWFVCYSAHRLEQGGAVANGKFLKNGNFQTMLYIAVNKQNTINNKKKKKDGHTTLI